VSSMRCCICEKQIVLWNITYVFTGPNGASAAPVNCCAECIAELIGSANLRKLRRVWADAPYVQVELPLDYHRQRPR
jgi:hypothetical protein